MYGNQTWYPHLEYFLLTGMNAELRIIKSGIHLEMKITGAWKVEVNQQPVPVNFSIEVHDFAKTLSIADDRIEGSGIYPPKAERPYGDRFILGAPQSEAWKEKLARLPYEAEVRCALAFRCPTAEIWMAQIVRPHRDMQDGMSMAVDCAVACPWQAIDRVLAQV